MELWMKLLFGNPIGLLSMIVVTTTIVIIGYLAYFFISRSGRHDPH